MSTRPTAFELTRLNRNAELFCRDQLREARREVLKDGEAFMEVLFSIERIGAILTGRGGNLREYEPALTALAQRSPLADDFLDEAQYQATFSDLFKLVRHARNDALHIGAFARHLAARTIELSLVLEDALVNGSPRVADYMVRGPTCTELWQPLRLVRQQMLANSYSYLPLRVGSDTDAEWKLISDLALARYLAADGTPEERKRRLAQKVSQAAVEGLELTTPKLALPDAAVPRLLEEASSVPILVVTPLDQLLGIVTAFDLL